MDWLFGKKRVKSETKVRESIRDLMLADSQKALLTAATETADMAHLVTRKLKSKLEDTMAQIESTARILNDALIICDSNGKVQAFNPAAEKIFDMTSDEVRSSFVGDLFNSKTHNFKTFEDIWTFLAMMDISEEEHDLSGKRKDHSVFPIEINHTRLDRSDGSSIILLAIRDIGSHHQTLNEVTEKMKCYKSIFDESFDGILVVKGQKILAANRTVSNLYGYSVEELLAQSIDMLIFSANMGKHHDGHLIDISFTTSNIVWQNEPASLITIKTKKNENKNKEAKMICFFDKEFKITFANSIFANWYNLSKDELIGKDIRQLLKQEEYDIFLVHINSLTPENPTRKMELRTRGENGKVNYQIWTDHVAYDKHGAEYQRIGHAG